MYICLQIYNYKQMHFVPHVSKRKGDRIHNSDATRNLNCALDSLCVSQTWVPEVIAFFVVDRFFF